MSRRNGKVANPFFALSELGVMRFYLLHEGAIPDDCDYDSLTVITSDKKGCVGGLGNLAGGIRRQKFPPSVVVLELITC